MEQTGTKTLLRNKILKILGLLLLVRVSLYVPVPGIDLDILTKGTTLNPLFGFAKTLWEIPFLELVL